MEKSNYTQQNINPIKTGFIRNVRNLARLKKIIYILIILMGLFSCNSNKTEKSNIKNIVYDNFNDDSNNWINKEFNEPPFLHKIENGMLYLDSTSDEMGIVSYVNFKIDESKDFKLETRLKIDDDSDDSYITFDFGILQSTDGRRTVSGLDISTSYGQKNYYFGYSNAKEVLITKWNKGKEKYLHRGYFDSIKLGDFNILKIKKENKTISFYINDQVVFSTKFKKLPGIGFGFSSSPNSKVYIDYFSIDN